MRKQSLGRGSGIQGSAITEPSCHQVVEVVTTHHILGAIDFDDDGSEPRVGSENRFDPTCRGAAR